MIDKERAFEILIVTFFAVFGGAARFALSPPRERGIGVVLASLVVAGFAGIITWQVLEACGYSQQLQAAGAGIAGLLENACSRLHGRAKRFRDDPSACSTDGGEETNDHNRTLPALTIATAAVAVVFFRIAGRGYYAAILPGSRASCLL